jgi:hypothetical protein
MSRIAKKSRSVKGVKRGKPSRAAPSPPRYTIRKDSLDRRYAIEKRTGKRVPISKADNERAKRRKAIQKAQKPSVIFRGITSKIPSKQPKAKSTRRTTKKSRSQAAKKGWETRRAKLFLEETAPPYLVSPIRREEPEIEWRPPTFEELIGPLVPEGMRMYDLEEGIAERAAKYPKVAEAAMLAWLKLVIEINERKGAEANGLPVPPIVTPRFDRLYGQGHGEYVRSNYFAYAKNLAELDTMNRTLAEDEDNDYNIRELYTLYFSPDVM